jgi:hypothetical protein
MRSNPQNVQNAYSSDSYQIKIKCVASLVLCLSISDLFRQNFAVKVVLLRKSWRLGRVILVSSPIPVPKSSAFLSFLL